MNARVMPTLPVIHPSEQGESVLVDGMRVQVRRSARRRTLGLTIERDGTVSAVAPTALPSAELARVVETRRLWIQSALARRSAMVASEQVAGPAYVSGESFPYLGRRYRLKLLPPGEHPVGAPALSLTGGRFLLRAEARIKGAEIFRRWYATHLEPWLHARLGPWQRRVGVEIRRLVVMELGNRWGSCSRENARLNVHWRVAQLPPPIIAYVIVHELCHLLEPHHDAAFWELVRRTEPTYAEKERWLREQGGRGQS